MDLEKKRGYRTLLASVLLSSPGPLVLGLGLMAGHSSTQISDFTRRTAEFMAILVSFIIYASTNKKTDIDELQKKLTERRGNVFVGAIMCASGLSMLFLTFVSGDEDKGNVLLPLVIAFLGAITNIFFGRRYTALRKKQNNSILEVQARLYGAKSVVDLCVVTALLAVTVLPHSRISFYLDLVGSIVVSLYMIRCGIKTILEYAKRIDESFFP